MGKKNGDGGGLFAAYLAAMPENPSTADTQTGADFSADEQFVLILCKYAYESENPKIRRNFVYFIDPLFILLRSMQS